MDLRSNAARTGLARAEGGRARKARAGRGEHAGRGKHRGRAHRPTAMAECAHTHTQTGKNKNAPRWGRVGPGRVRFWRESTF